jgi:hypothetical protein
MANGRSGSRSGIYAAITTIAITAGLGIVGAAGADEAANADIYVRGDPGGGVNCFSDDATPAPCTAGETAVVTINTNETVTFHFEGEPHNAIGNSPVPWKVPDPPPEHAPKGSTYTETFTQPGDYAFVCSVHEEMTGTIKVLGPPPTETTAPPSSPPPSGEVTTPPPSGGGDDGVKPTVRSVRTKALNGGVRVQFKLSEPATVTVRVKRRGASKTLKSKSVQAAAGTRSVTLRSKQLKKGKYTVEVQARDAFGNRSSLAKKQLSLPG